MGVIEILLKAYQLITGLEHSLFSKLSGIVVHVRRLAGGQPTIVLRDLLPSSYNDPDKPVTVFEITGLMSG